MAPCGTTALGRWTRPGRYPQSELQAMVGRGPTSAGFGVANSGWAERSTGWRCTGKGGRTMPY